MSDVVAVRNTFLDVRRSFQRPVRRSASLPRTFKPVEFAVLTESCCESCCDEHHFARSDDSTSVCISDVNGIDNMQSTCSDCYSEDPRQEDFPDCCSDCTDDDFDCPDMCLPHNSLPPSVCCAGTQTDTSRRSRLSLFALVPEERQSTKPSLSLSALVPDEDKCVDESKPKLCLANMVEEKAKTKLRSQAQSFKSVTEPPAEVRKLLDAAVEVLASGEDIIDVHVRDGGMGGTTVIIGKSSQADPDPYLTFSLVKAAMLNAAEKTESTYVLGYGVKPFKNLDSLSFSGTIACVPAAQQDTMCWDLYERGHCSSSRCCCTHPAVIDKMDIIVMVQKGASKSAEVAI